MKKTMLRALCACLCLLLVLTLSLPCAKAARSAGAQREIFYGNIRMLGANADEVTTYKAARDENDAIYIRAEDFAQLTGAALYATSSDTYHYKLGLRHLYVNTATGTGEVYYNFNNGDGIGYPLYGEFDLTDCLYNKEKESWYFPLEELLYMAGMEWGCEDGVVLVYRPETLFEIVADSADMLADNPDYTDVMGDGEWEQVGNSFKYGIQAAIDDIDMTFIADSILTTLNFKETMTYEDKSLQAALLTLRSDAPEAGADGVAASSKLNDAADFIDAVSTGLDLASTEIGHDAFSELVADMLHVYLRSDTAEALSDYAAVGSKLVGYALGVGQALWAREYMPESLAQRLERIQSVSAGQDDSFCRQLERAAGDVYDLYYGDISNAYLQGVTLDSIAAMVDGVIKLGADLGKNDLVVAPLRWASLTVGAFDLGVEVLKSTTPSIQQAMDDAEDVNLSLCLVRTGSVMQTAYRDAVMRLRLAGSGLDQDLLDELRECAQVTEGCALRAHEKLYALGKMSSAGLASHAAYLQRLDESAKYDGLLLLSSSFAGIHSNEPGCVRQEIPPEYVYGLPVIDMELTTGMANVEAKPMNGEPLDPELPRLTVDTTDIDKYGWLNSVTLTSDRYGTFRYTSHVGAMYGRLRGVDMGDGEYSYILMLYSMGTVGGAEVLFLRPVNGQLTAVKTFDTQQRDDGIYVEGHFLDGDTVTGVIYPTGTEFTKDVRYSMDDRTGKGIFENGLGVANYELNDRGYYDLVFHTIHRCLANMDGVGNGCTRYTLEDGQLVLAEQWYETDLDWAED